jgi:hypothetical protein
MSSTAYWYAARPTRIASPPPVLQRLPVKKVDGKWVIEPGGRCPGKPVVVTPEMKQLKEEWKQAQKTRQQKRLSEWHSPFVTKWKLSSLLPAQDIRKVRGVRLAQKLGWRRVGDDAKRAPFFINVHGVYGDQDGLVYLGNKFKVKEAGAWTIHLGHDGPARVFVDGKAALTEPKRLNPARQTRSQATVKLSRGTHEIIVALDTDGGLGWGIYLSFEVPPGSRKKGLTPQFPKAIA